MNLIITEQLIITLSFLLFYALVIALVVHFIFRKNLILRNYIFLGIATAAALVSFYTTLFIDTDNIIQSLLLTVILIGLTLQQIRLKKKLNK
ncbi:hypothetical protein ABD76_15320 [Paenibacillus dendritiformis]|nr:hypothetical protein [Paenibacillus dendritiformis]